MLGLKQTVRLTAAKSNCHHIDLKNKNEENMKK